MTSDPFGDVFLRLLTFFEEKGVEYYVTRNYEDYPVRFTGDIDLYVDLRRLLLSETEYSRLLTDSGWRIFRSVKRPWVLVYQLIASDESLERRVMVIEHFCGFQWLEFPYLRFGQVSPFGTRHNGISVLQKDVGYFLAFCHYFFWAGFVPEKYQQAFGAAFKNARVTELVREAFPAVWREVLGEVEVISGLQSRDWRKTRDVPERIHLIDKTLLRRAKIGLACRAFRSKPLRSAVRVLRMVGLKFGDYLRLDGLVIFLRGATAVQAKDLQRKIRKYHLYKNRSNVVLDGADVGFVGSLRILKEVLVSLAGGGACVVRVPRHPTPTSRVLETIFKRRRLTIPAEDVGQMTSISSVVSMIESSPRGSGT